MIARDGSVIWFHDQATIVIPGVEAGEPYLHGVMLDITDRKDAEAKVRESQARLAEAQRLAEMGSWELELSTQRLSLSDELYRICGVRREEFEASFEGGLELVHPDDRPMVERMHAEVTRDPKPFDYQLRILRPDGDVRTIENHG